MFLRAIGPAIILTIGMSVAIMQESRSIALGDLLQSAAIVFGVALFSVTFIYPLIGLICWWLLSFFVRVEGKARRFVTPDNGVFLLPLLVIGLIGFLGYIGLTILVMLGDPFVFVLHKAKPGWVPVQKYNFLNFVPIVFVLDPNYVDRLRMTSQTA
jgi:hypothetical protein